MIEEILEFVFENVPYWVVQLTLLLFFSFLSLLTFKIRSKAAVIFSITLWALLTFYLLNFFSMHYCEDVKVTAVSEEDLRLVGSYCNEEPSDLSTLLEFLKAFVLWSVALTLFFFKSKFTQQKPSR